MPKHNPAILAALRQFDGTVDELHEALTIVRLEKHGCIGHAAESMGISHRTLVRWMKFFNVLAKRSGQDASQVERP